MYKFLIIIMLLFQCSFGFANEVFFTIKENDSLILKSQNSSAPYLQKSHKELDFNFSPDLLKKKELIEFELVDGFNIQVRRLSLKESINGGFIWLGRVQGDPNSYASFVIQENNIVGEIYAGGKIYRLAYDENKSAFMHEMVVNKSHPFSKENDALSIPKNISTKAIVSEPSTDQFVDIILATTTEAAANPGAAATI